MHAIYSFLAIVALAGYLFCDGFLNGRFGIARLGRQLPRLPSLAKGRVSKPALLPPLRADATIQPRHGTAKAVKVIETFLQELAAARDKGDVRVFVQTLNALASGLRGQTLAQPHAERVVDLMGSIVERIVNPSDVASLLSSLGKLGFQASIPKQRALIIKSVQQLCKTEKMDSVELSMSLDGLAKTGLKRSDISSELRKGLLEVIDRTADQLPSRNLANILKALGKLEASWPSLPSVTQKVLLQSFERNAAALMTEHPLTAAMTVHSFGKLGLDSSTLTHEQRELVFQVAMNGIKEEYPGQTPSQASMTIFGLGGMAIAHASLPNGLRSHMESCLLHLLPAMSAQEVSNIIYAFGQMCYQCAMISPALLHALQTAATQRMPGVTSQNIFMILHGFANMDTKWANLMPEFRNSTEQAVVAMLHLNKLHRHDSAQHVANSMHSLGKMRAEWTSFSSAFHLAVLNAFILLHGRFKPQHISNFIYGLGCMGAPFQDLSPAFKTAVQKAMHRSSESADSFKPQAIANILLGFAYMGASWDQLPTKQELEHLLVRRALNMNAQEVTNTIHSLAVMEALWRSLSSDAVRAAASACEAIAPTMISHAVANSMYGLTLLCFDVQPTSMGSSPAELEKEQLMWRMIRALVKRFRLLGREEYDKEGDTQFAIFFEWLSGLPGGMELITEELGSRPAFTNPDGVHAPTALHLALSQALPKALQQLQPVGQFHIANEFDGLGGHVFAMDMAVHQDGKLIAFVEVDSSYHYNGDGTKRRKDLLKEWLYAQRYPGVPMYRALNRHLASKGTDSVAAELADLMKHRMRL